MILRIDLYVLAFVCFEREDSLPYIEFDAYRFHYRYQQGENPSILMLCSTGMDARQWSRLMRLLPSRNCFALNYVGYPPSSAVSLVDWRLDYRAAESLLLQQQNKIDLVGHSYGGFLALKLAVAYPQRIRSLALHEPIAWGSLADSPDTSLQESFRILFARLFLQNLSSEDWLEVFVDFWNQPGVWASLPEERKQVWRMLYPKIYSEVEGLCSDTTPLSYWQAVQSPVLITVGEQAPPHEQEVCRLLGNTIIDCTVKTVVGGHLAPVTHPHVVLPIFTEYLSL